MAKSVAQANAAIAVIQNETDPGDNNEARVSGTMYDMVSACTLELQAPATAAFTAVAGALYPIDTGGGAFSIAPPAVPVLNDMFGVVDVAGSASLANATITFGAQKLMGTAQSYVLDFNYATQIFVYSGATNGWLIKS